MKYKIGFIGCGNMAKAIIKGIINKDIIQPNLICASDLDADKLAEFCGETGISAASSNEEVVANSEYVFLAVKPVFIKQVADEIKAMGVPIKTVSIAAAWTTRMLSDALPGSRVLRVIPNTSLLVAESFTALADGSSFEKADIDFIRSIFDASGSTAIIEEKHFDAVTAIASAGSMYAFMLIESLADAGVLHGLSRAQSIDMAAQAVLGGAKLALESDKHTAQLKDDVCSPGGITIEAVRVLEKQGYRSAIIEAVAASVNKSADMAKNN
ncbi:MAG: pyrroline-5-carboxylate reductase [Christensenellales bacterium]|jgi:pyrroline-5-carboxylate reductase